MTRDIEDQLIIREDCLDLIFLIFDNLSDRQLTILILSLFGFSYAEIAHVLGLSVCTVRSHICRARSVACRVAKEYHGRTMYDL